MSNEATTCHTYVVPRLQQAGWAQAPHSVVEQYTFTDGRIVVVGSRVNRQRGKRADYLLRYARDVALAVVEAKAEYRRPADGLQQAKEYAEILGLKFAYATNGHSIVEFDFLTGQERELEDFPTPADLWARYQAGQHLDPAAAQRLLAPAEHRNGQTPRYYQEIAVRRTLQAIFQGRSRILLTLATGTGKTLVAFQICAKLWGARWNRLGTARRPKILFLADRTVLIDDPKDKAFASFGDARWRLEGGEANQSRDIYFSTYQSLARDERRPGLYRDFPPDFFDLIIVDECHRGSASDESNWREILEYFAPAFQIGMTATPRRDDNVDTYTYFGEPIYTYSLRQGIEDGFLAPYRVKRIVTSVDALGWRPAPNDRDRYGRVIPDAEYRTPNFERQVALRARTEAIARHLTDHLQATDRFAKTIVFCVDQDHALEMRRALVALNADLVQRYPNYVVRITADEGDVGRGLLDQFKDVETRTPALVTTSHLLTTGVDVPTCKNVVIVRVINSMTEFKQIVGRGTRVREDADKLSFTILDYTGSATRLFADPAFDGEPLAVVQERMEDDGSTAPDSQAAQEPPLPAEPAVGETRAGYTLPASAAETARPSRLPRKLYFDGGYVEIVAQVVYELDAEGHRLRMVQLADYAAGKLRILTVSDADLRARWSDPARRAELLVNLEERGVSLEALAQAVGQPEADPLDLLAHVAYHAPLQTRRERADRLRREQSDFLASYGERARAVLDDLLEKYAEHGVDQFQLPYALKLPPISQYGTVSEISAFFGSVDVLRAAVRELEQRLYAA